MSKKVPLQIIFLSLLVLATFSESGEVDWTNQTVWGDDCGGMYQTPIDINSRKVQFCDWSIYFHLKAICMDFEYVEEGQSLTVQAEGVNYLSMYEYDHDLNQTMFSAYKSLQLNYHNPSEHTINGQSYDLEMHLVHTFDQEATDYHEIDNITSASKNGSLAVVGILFKEDLFVEEDVFDKFIPQGNQTMSNFLESFQCISDRFFYHYKGSLTTPPCSEAVEWFILRDPLPIRPENLKRFKSDINFGRPNNREIQPLNNRTVYLTSPWQCQEMGFEKDEKFVN